MNWRRTSTTVAVAAATVFAAFVRPGSLLRRVGATPVGVNTRPCAGSHCATGLAGEEAVDRALRAVREVAAEHGVPDVGHRRRAGCPGSARATDCGVRDRRAHVGGAVEDQRRHGGQRARRRRARGRRPASRRTAGSPRWSARRGSVNTPSWLRGSERGGLHGLRRARPPGSRCGPTGRRSPRSAWRRTGRCCRRSSRPGPARPARPAGARRRTGGHAREPGRAASRRSSGRLSLRSALCTELGSSARSVGFRSPARRMSNRPLGVRIARTVLPSGVLTCRAAAP